MTRLWNTILFAFLANHVVCQERYAPGVPPPQAGQDIKFHDPNDMNQQQQPPPQQQHQQHQQQPQHQQHQPPQHQQHNQQQHQQQQAGGQQAEQGGAGGHHGEAHHHDHQFGETLDQEHLEKHKKDKYVDTSKMSERERIWYQFQNFDLDKDGLVDGMEIIKSILHYRGDDTDNNKDGAKTNTESVTVEELDEIAASTDEGLKIYDENDDGYISFKEFADKMIEHIKKEESEKQNATPEPKQQTA